MCIYIHKYAEMGHASTAYLSWSDILKSLIHCSKLRARWSLFSETWQKEHTSFGIELGKKQEKKCGKCRQCGFNWDRM